MPRDVEYYGFDIHTHGGLVFGVEKLEAIAHEIEPHCAEHWTETEGYLETYMNVDWPRYIMMERKSTLILFSVRTADGELAGYIIFTIAPHANAQHKLLASEAAFFMAPAHRGTAVLRLVDYAEDSLRKLGVHYVTIGDKSPSGGASLERLLGRRGYQTYAVTHIKILEDDDGNL